MLKYKVLTKGCEPKRMRIEDAGIDLSSAIDCSIMPLSSSIIPLGVAVGIEKGEYGLLTHRSSMAFKHGAIASLGIIDSNFLQEVKVCMFNMSPYYSLEISKGDRICQLVLHKYCMEEMEEVDDLGVGKGGFGSSGGYSNG